MKDEIVRELFIVKNGSGMRVSGTRFTTLTISEDEWSGSLAFASDPLAALSQQNLQAAAMEKSRVESIRFERLPWGLAIVPGYVLESQMFGDSLRVVSYSDTEMTAEIEPV